MTTYVLSNPPQGYEFNSADFVLKKDEQTYDVMAQEFAESTRRYYPELRHWSNWACLHVWEIYWLELYGIENPGKPNGKDDEF